MQKKLMQQIVDFSYTDDNLDEKKVIRFADLLSRKDLKSYINKLVTKEKKSTVLISSPVNPKKYQKEFEEIFTNKKMQFEIDQSLIAGVKIVSDDMIYEMSLKNTLEELNNYVNE